jgi:hypothetical protein
MWFEYKTGRRIIFRIVIVSCCICCSFCCICYSSLYCLCVSCSSVIYCFCIVLLCLCIVSVLCLCVMFVTCLLYCCTTATGLKPNCILTHTHIYIVMRLEEEEEYILKTVFMLLPEKDNKKLRCMHNRIKNEADSRCQCVFSILLPFKF